MARAPSMDEPRIAIPDDEEVGIAVRWAEQFQAMKGVWEQRGEVIKALDAELSGYKRRERENPELKRLTELVEEQAATIVQLEQDVFRADADAARWREEHRDVELKLHRGRTESDRAGREDELAIEVELLEKDLVEAKEALKQVLAEKGKLIERLDRDFVRVSRELNEERRKNERLVDENNRVRAKIYGVDPKTEPKEGWAAAWLGGGTTFSEVTKGEKVTITPVVNSKGEELTLYHEQG